MNLELNTFDRRATFAFISYGMLALGVVVLLFPMAPWLALLVPVVYCIREWRHALPYSTKTTKVFAPDPLSPDLSAVAKAIAAAVDATVLNESVDWLLCPFCNDTSFVPYEIDYSDEKRLLTLRSKDFTKSYPLKVRMKFEAPLPLRVVDRPLRIRIFSKGDYAFLHFWQQPVYSWLLLPRYLHLALFLSLLIMYHFAVIGTILDNPLQQIFLAFLALVLSK